MVAIYSKRQYVAERELGALLRRFRNKGCDAINPVLDGIADDQAAAVELACTNPYSIVYGKPGTGKTTTVRRIVQSFDRAGMKGIVATPTGKAAKRSDEVLSTDDIKYYSRPTCSTTFRVLGFRGGQYEYNLNNPLKFDYAVIEEGSMLSGEDAKNFHAAIDPKHTRVVLVGDPYQLPSVGAGNFLYDLINSHKFPKTELRKIYRQGANSGIVHNAGRVLAGKMPDTVDPITGEKFKDYFFVPTDDELTTLNKLLDFTCEKIPAKYSFDPVKDIQVLSPGKNGLVGTHNLNDQLRLRLNPNGKAGFRDFRVGDKVINKKNRYDVGIVNGDVGIIVDITPHGMEVDFGLGSNVEIDKDLGDSIFLAYAYTVHGSQGSEYPCCLMPIHRCHWKLLFQNLIYTGMTRGKQYVLQMGDVTAMQYGVAKTVTDKRRTGLRHWI